ncbi:uncharacterized protein TRIADDRAFT_24819 [Trichoplax adhaerens]|uniref:MOSC domain-containing protein n=1 Tax=Trichoplax adhaerens TaxID=10228 RepID=B3RWG5_TRIAD|nr:hypothetical protein TRIADDRAFT_24819 [Trichoplax adhaerens]EDV25131.1 hypothetical protein TRIADDRAFT_24819 [Trichoplax adhaerens]|eukprot:XP_002113021.1 hypothetical protein TRIADDRAFT_24819 [Trichoplax adhaerens]
MAGDRDSSTIITTVTITAAALIATYLIYRTIRKSSQKLIGRVKQLYIYPIKSCAGIKLDAADCNIDGFKWDRRWIIIDENDLFLTLRSEPTLALVQPSIEDGQLKLTAPDMPPVAVPLEVAEGATSKEIKIWRTNITAFDCGKEIGDWFSKYLNKSNLKLLFKPDTTPNRYVKDDSIWGVDGQSNDQCAFADLTPYHLTFTASLDVLNTKSSRQISMQSFRPNIIVETEEPHVEDHYKYYHIKDTTFRKVKNCERCLLTTVDPNTGVRDVAREPLKSMRTYRKSADPRQKNSPLFGINTAIDRLGPIAIGNSVFAN